MQLFPMFSVPVGLLVFFASCGLLAAQQKPFTVYKDCKLIKQNGNDGDSFSIVGKDPKNPKIKKNMVVRLYGVDCMETNANAKFAPDRLTTQGLYFGIHKKDMARAKFRETLKLGKDASDFARRALIGKFTVLTKHVPAMGLRNRIYAYVITADGEDLGELLVRNGLARIHGVVHDRPSDVVPGQYWHSLRAEEMLAMEEKNGAWKRTDWENFSKERAQYAKRIARKFYINRLENNAENAAIIADEADVPLKIVQAVIKAAQEKPFNNAADIDERVDGVGKVTAAKLGKVFVFDE